MTGEKNEKQRQEKWHAFFGSDPDERIANYWYANIYYGGCSIFSIYAPTKNEINEYVSRVLDCVNFCEGFTLSELGSLTDVWAQHLSDQVQLSTLRAEIERLKWEGKCDACAGTGKAESGPCGCNGTGKIVEMLYYVRGLLFFKENQLECLQSQLATEKAEHKATTEQLYETSKAAEWVKEWGDEIAHFLEEAGDPDDDATKQLRALIAELKGGKG
jgi:hypothetical protein